MTGVTLLSVGSDFTQDGRSDFTHLGWFPGSAVPQKLLLFRLLDLLKLTPPAATCVGHTISSVEHTVSSVTHTVSNVGHTVSSDRDTISSVGHTVSQYLLKLISPAAT